MNKEKNIKPIVLTNTETGDVYTLEFTKDSVRYAQDKGFNVDEIDKKPMVVMPELFYYAFRAHHKNVTPAKANSILFDDLGGMPDGMLERLMELYYLPYKCLIGDEESSKNSKMTVEF